MKHDIVVLFERKLLKWSIRGVFFSHTHTIWFSSTISNYCCQFSSWMPNQNGSCSACHFNPDDPYLQMGEFLQRRISNHYQTSTENPSTVQKRC